MPYNENTNDNGFTVDAGFTALLTFMEHMAGYEDEKHLKLFGIALCRAADEVDLPLIGLRNRLKDVATSTDGYCAADWMEWLFDNEQWDDFCIRADLARSAQSERLESYVEDSELPENSLAAE